MPSIIKENSIRQSNIELLRLLCMLMVLNLHSFWGHEHGEGILNIVDFFRESTSICAVDTFVLISGFFGIKWKFKSFFNLVFQLFFYSFTVYGICVALGVFPFVMEDFKSCFYCLFNSWGFITTYLQLYLISPLLNAFSEKVSAKDHLVFIIVLFVAENFILTPFTSNDLFNFSLMYLIGRLMYRTQALKKLEVNPYIGYLLMTTLMCAIIYSLHLASFNRGNISSNPFASRYSSPFVILQSVFLFIIFGRITIKSRAVNWLAASCLSIFLIHMHPAIKQIGYYQFTENLYEKSVFDHILILTILMILVFFGSILIDKIRIFISKSCYNGVMYIYRKLPQNIKSLNHYLPYAVKNIL